MPRLLTNLDIQEVSSVDRGAAKGARALLFKRDASKVNQATIDKALALALKSALNEGAKTDDLVALFKEFQTFIGKAEQQESDMTPEEISKLVADEIGKALAEFAKAQKPKNDADADEGDAADATGGNEGGAENRKSPVPGKKKKIDGDADEAKGRKPKFGKVEGEIEGDVELQKRDEEIKKLSDEVKKLREKDQRVEFGKRAVALGLSETEGEMLLKAHQGDPEALKKIEEKIAALVKQVNEGKLFDEFGSGGESVRGGAHEALVSKAGEIRKRAGNEKLTAEAAYVKAMEENPELTKQEKVERDRRINKQAQ